MIKYDIRTGITKIKTKTAIVASAAVLAISGLGMAVIVPAISNATGVPANYPSTCDAGHGAPGGLGAHSPYPTGSIQSESGDQNNLPNGTLAPSAGSQFGMEQGADTTGQNNSGLAAYCRTL